MRAVSSIESLTERLTALEEKRRELRASIAGVKNTARDLALLARHLTRKLNLLGEFVPDSWASGAIIETGRREATAPPSALAAASSAAEPDAGASAAASSAAKLPVEEVIFMKGYVYKKGRRVRNWKQRFFVLKAGVLSYYVDETCASRKGVLKLDKCTIDSFREREETGRPCLALINDGRTLYFHAEDPREDTSWFLAISCMQQQLTYSRKMAEQRREPDPTVRDFFDRPMRFKLSLDGRTPSLPLEALEALDASIRYHSVLHVLSLRRSGLTDAHLAVLGEALAVNKSIGVLHLSDNVIGDEGFAQLARALSRNRNVTELYLEGNRMGDAGASAIAAAMAVCKHLQTLALDNNTIGAVGAEALATAIARPHRMKVLAFSGNPIGDAGALALAKAVLRNDMVEAVEWRSCSLSSQGIVAICQLWASQAQRFAVVRLELSDNTFDANYVRKALTAMIRTCRSLRYLACSPFILSQSALELVRMGDAEQPRSV